MATDLKKWIDVLEEKKIEFVKEHRHGLIFIKIRPWGVELSFDEDGDYRSVETLDD